MSYAAQCLMCQHAKRRGRLPVACARFPDPDLTQIAVNSILYRMAGSGRCDLMEGFNAPKDAYMAEDDPNARTIGDIINDAAKAARRQA